MVVPTSHLPTSHSRLRGVGEDGFVMASSLTQLLRRAVAGPPIQVILLKVPHTPCHLQDILTPTAYWEDVYDHPCKMWQLDFTLQEGREMDEGFNIRYNKPG